MVMEFQFNDIFGENLYNSQQLDTQPYFYCVVNICCQGFSHKNNPNKRRNIFSGHGTTKTILREIKYFKTLTRGKGNFTQIALCDIVIIGFGQAILIRPIVIQLLVEDAFLYPDSTYTLLSYKISITMLSMWKLIMTTMMNINSS